MNPDGLAVWLRRCSSVRTAPSSQASPGGVPLLTLLVAGGILGTAVLALGGGLALACTLSRRHFARTRTTDG